LDDNRVSLVYDKFDCLEDFLRVTCEERKAIKAANIEDLNTIIAKKRSIIAKINHLDGQIKKVKTSVPPDFFRIAKDFISEIAVFQRENEKMLKDVASKTRQEINEFQNQEKVRQVYKDNLPSNLTKRARNKDSENK